MSRNVTVECPSGFVVTVREFAVRDEDLAADPRAIRQGVAVTNLLNAVTVHVEDPGPYSLVERRGDLEPSVDWNEVLQGDRTVALVRNRIHTWPEGQHLPCRLPCPNCRQPVSIDVDLEEMPIKPLPEASLAHVRGEGDLTVTLPGCGQRVSFRLLRGKDEKTLKKIAKSKKGAQSSAYLRFRITDVDGVPQSNWGSWLRELGAGDASYLRAAFDEADCGVDTTIEYECPECDHVWEDDARFPSDFLFPKHRGKTTST